MVFETLAKPVICRVVAWLKRAEGWTRSTAGRTSIRWRCGPESWYFRVISWLYSHRSNPRSSGYNQCFAAERRWQPHAHPANRQNLA
jgi:hypothetical protein